MNTYSVWVMEYCWVRNYHLSGLIYGAHNQGHRKLPYGYVVIKGGGHVAMVDVGYNHKAYGEVLANLYGVENWHPPSEVLKEIGLAPADIQTIFLTHAHFDHMGNTEDFPNATFYIQERELAKWVWTMSLERRMRWLMLGIDPGDILRIVDLARQKRLVAVDGDRQNVLPGVDLHAAPDTHTWGSMWVHLRNDLASQSADSYAFAGDLIYTQENLRGDDPADPQYIPIGFALGSQFNLMMASQTMVNAVGGDINRVIAVHEERLKDLYPSRITSTGLRVTQLCLADGEPSRV